MRKGNVALMLVYEPASTDVEPVPLVRVCDNTLAVAVAESAIREAEARVREITLRDEFLGEIEQTEVRRLRELLSLLVPGFGKPKQSGESTASVM